MHVILKKKKIVIIRSLIFKSFPFVFNQYKVCIYFLFWIGHMLGITDAYNVFNEMNFEDEK